MKTSTRIVVAAGLLVALVLAGVVSYYASGEPDGLNRVAIDRGFDKGQKAHSLDDSPLAGYAMKGVDNGRLSGGLAGVAGVGVTFLLGGAIVLAVRRRSSETRGVQGHDKQGLDAGGRGR